MEGEAIYNGAHSITFWDGESFSAQTGLPIGTNTWEDWHLIPASKPMVAPPGVSTSYVDIPGRAPLDLTEYLTGGVVYGQRSGSWEFIIDNGQEHWEYTRKKIMNHLHGLKKKVVLDDVPDWYWEGRFSVSNLQSEDMNNTITIDYVLDPYCWSIYSNKQGELIRDWLWDPFEFDRDYTDGRNYSGSYAKRL